MADASHIEVLKPGLATSVQDKGRQGYYHLGIPPSGALDQYALAAANLLVGNAEDAAVLECTLLGPELLFHRAALIAVTGATMAPKIDGKPMPCNMALAVPAAMPEAPWRELLATQPFIRYDRASFGGRVVDLFLKKHRIRVHEAVELDEIEAIANMVRHGLGVALLPRLRRLDMTGLRLLPLGEAAFQREIGLIGRLPFEPGSMRGKIAECLLAAAAEP